MDMTVGDKCPFCSGMDISHDWEDIRARLENEISKEELMEISRTKGRRCSICNEGVVTEETVKLWEELISMQHRHENSGPPLEGFNGFDWTELEAALKVDREAEVRPLLYVEQYEEQWLPLRRKLEEMRSKHMDDPNDSSLQEELANCRSYTRAYMTYWDRLKSSRSVGKSPALPLYEGLLQIEDDSVFLEYLILLFPYMWN